MANIFESFQRLQAIKPVARNGSKSSTQPTNFDKFFDLFAQFQEGKSGAKTFGGPELPAIPGVPTGTGSNPATPVPAGSSVHNPFEAPDAISSNIPNQQEVLGPKPPDIQRLLSQIPTISGLIKAVEANGNLSPQAEEMLASAREEQARMISELDTGINQQLQSLQFIDAILQKQLQPDKDVVLDQIFTTASAEDLKPGLSKEWLDNLLANADDPEAFSAITDAEFLRQEALVEIENFVFQKEQLRDNFASFKEDLRNQDLANTTGFDLLPFDPSPEGLKFEAFVQKLENVNIDHLSDDRQVQLLQTLQEAFVGLQSGEFSQLGTADPLQFLVPIADEFEVNLQQLKTSFLEGIESAAEATTILDEVTSSGRIQPFTRGASAFIFDVASQRVPVENAQVLARSPLFHKILEMSNGNPKFQAGGDLKGIGSLSERVYNELGTPYASIADDPAKQLDALISYLMVGWGEGGQINIRQAYIDMVQNNEWGTLPLLRHSRGSLPDSLGQLPSFGVGG